MPMCVFKSMYLLLWHLGDSRNIYDGGLVVIVSSCNVDNMEEMMAPHLGNVNA